MALALRLGAYELLRAEGSDPVLLLDQDRSRWDRVLIGRGMAALARAEELGVLGPYTLQAAIAACHARAVTADQTDWGRIVALYDALAQVSPSPVVELNRAVAVSMAYGPGAALELVDLLMEKRALSDYHLLPSVRADLLARLGRVDEARAELARAVELTQNESERRLLSQRAAELNHLIAHVISVHEVKTYKPIPAVYALAERRLGLPRPAMRFVSSNAWDAAGAKSFGLPVAWVNRAGAPAERLGFAPDLIVRDLEELVDHVSG